MKILPNETAYDILKFLNYDQLSCFRQVDRRFCGLINGFEEEFARKEFQSVSMVRCFPEVYTEYKRFMKNCGVIETEIPFHYLSKKTKKLVKLKRKWQAAIRNKIRLFRVDKSSESEFIIRLINKG
uniref:F-box domain-containing protein n=1 Tax=Meloidogyne hapla TaxID=6305 RepID=A0A1I8BEV6_MELHA